MIAIRIDAGARNVHPAALCFAISDIPFSWNSQQIPPFAFLVIFTYSGGRPRYTNLSFFFMYRITPSS